MLLLSAACTVNYLDRRFLDCKCVIEKPVHVLYYAGLGLVGTCLWLSGHNHWQLSIHERCFHSFARAQDLNTERSAKVCWQAEITFKASRQQGLIVADGATCRLDCVKTDYSDQSCTLQMSVAWSKCPTLPTAAFQSFLWNMALTQSTNMLWYIGVLAYGICPAGKGASDQPVPAIQPTPPLLVERASPTPLPRPWCSSWLRTRSHSCSSTHARWRLMLAPTGATLSTCWVQTALSTTCWQLPLGKSALNLSLYHAETCHLAFVPSGLFNTALATVLRYLCPQAYSIPCWQLPSDICALRLSQHHAGNCPQVFVPSRLSQHHDGNCHQVLLAKSLVNYAVKT